MKIGIFYGSSSGKTEALALKMLDLIGPERAEIHDVAEARPEQILEYDFLVFGIPTWGIGELQEDWHDFICELERMDLSGKQTALFGLGDQESYPDSFCDAMGEVFDVLKISGCQLTGTWPAEGYEFLRSKALREGVFVGLVLDEDNQAELSRGRLISWLRLIGLLS